MVRTLGQQRMDQVIEHGGMFGRERKGVLEVRDRGFDAAQLQKHVAAAVEGVDVAPIDCERPLIARQRLLVTRELSKNVATVEMGLGEVRLQGQGPVVAAERISWRPIRCNAVPRLSQSPIKKCGCKATARS